MERQDDFEVRRAHLHKLSEEQLEERFWDLAGRIMDPMVDLAKSHTSPSIERSVLLRMGFSSMEGNTIVEGCRNRGLLGKGAGHVVLKVARDQNLEIREAGLALLRGCLWDRAEALFGTI